MYNPAHHCIHTYTHCSQKTLRKHKLKRVRLRFGLKGRGRVNAKSERKRERKRERGFRGIKISDSNILQNLTLSIQMLQKSKVLAIKIINLPGDGVPNICSISPPLSVYREPRG